MSNSSNSPNRSTFAGPRVEHLVVDRPLSAAHDRTLTYYAHDGWEVAAAFAIGNNQVRMVFKRPVAPPGTMTVGELTAENLRLREENAKLGLQNGEASMAGHAAVQALVNILWLYPKYEVGSRGPSGLILDAIRVLEADTAAKLADGINPGSLLDPDDEGDCRDVPP